MAPVSYYSCAPDGKKLRTERDAVDLISEAHSADVIVIPVERLDPDFFKLRTGVAGQMLQKFVTYGKRIAIIGDISRRVEEAPHCAILWWKRTAASRSGLSRRTRIWNDG